MNMRVLAALPGTDLVFRYIPRRDAGSYDSSTFKFLRKIKTIVESLMGHYKLCQIISFSLLLF